MKEPTVKEITDACDEEGGKPYIIENSDLLGELQEEFESGKF